MCYYSKGKYGCYMKADMAVHAYNKFQMADYKV